MKIAICDDDLVLNRKLHQFIFETYHYMAKEYGIAFDVSGSFHSGLALSALEICTIFSNALDNAIEGNLRIEDRSKRYGLGRYNVRQRHWKSDRLHLMDFVDNVFKRIFLRTLSADVLSVTTLYFWNRCEKWSLSYS